MFGYATDETEECMPLTVVLAHKLNEKIAELRRNGVFWWARPDTKTQVINKYIYIYLNVIHIYSIISCDWILFSGFKFKILSNKKQI